MTKTFVINEGDRPTEEMYREIEKAKEYPVVFDEDCPKLSPAMLKALKSSAAKRNRRKNA